MDQDETCMEVGLGPDEFVLDGDPPPPSKKGSRSRPHRARRGSSSPTQKGAQLPPQFSAYVYCGQTAVCIRIPLDTEVGLGPGDVVIDGVPALPLKGAQLPSFRPMSIVAKRLNG